MIGVVPMADLAPLPYRYALDAAMGTLGPSGIYVSCDASELASETRQRWPMWEADAPPRGALWVEPDRATWPSRMAELSHLLGRDALLVIIASRPMARLLPERRDWSQNGVGLGLRGLPILVAGLRRSSFHLAAAYGIHSPYAIGLNILGRVLERAGRPDLADRLHFKARLGYQTLGYSAIGASVAVLIARNG